MAIIDKKFIHFKNYDDFISQAGVGSVANITTPTSGSEDTRNAVYGQIKGSSIVFIKDTKQIWTHGQLYSCNVDASHALWADENNVVNRENLLINGTRAHTTYSYGNSEDGLMFVDTYTFEGDTMLNSISLNGANGINLQSLAVNTPNLEEVTSGKMSRLSISDGKVAYEGIHMNYREEINPASTFALEPGFFTYQIYHINNTTGNTDPVSGLVIDERSVQLGHKSGETTHTLVINDDGVFVDDKKVGFEILNVTYSELKNLRDSAQLIPGAMYRITDYETKLSEYTEDTHSGGAGVLDHVLWGSFWNTDASKVNMDLTLKNYYFDIVVVALSSNEISEQAYAVHSARDVEGHFTNRNLSAWKVYYRLENKHDFWFIPKTAKGVIYKLINEYGNEAPYDFENVYYANMPVFGSNCTNNILDGYYITLGSNCHSNHIGKNSVRIKIGNNSSGNIFGVACRGIVLGSYCNYNTFGNNCVYLYDSDYGTFGGGFWITQSTPRNYCSHNTFANGCAPHLECAASANAYSKLQHLCVLTNSYDYQLEDGSGGGPELRTSASISLPINIINSESEIRVGTNSQGEIRIYRLEDLIN